ncbi:MAG: tetratricopeptide repeat protein [Azoarcus sp.]|jgi:tetratricopeptide (TPR) repeat protein|nr:tetratricopeptide repeat protein [Azoarcus sp.]
MNTENTTEHPENTAEQAKPATVPPENTTGQTENTTVQAENPAGQTEDTTAPPEATTLTPRTTIASDSMILALDTTTLATGATSLAPNTTGFMTDTVAAAQDKDEKPGLEAYIPILLIAAIATAIAVVFNLDLQTEDVPESLSLPAEPIMPAPPPEEPSMETLLQDLGPKQTPEDAPPKPEPRIMPHAKFNEISKEAQTFSETAEKYYRQGDCANALALHRKALANFELALGHLTKQLPLFVEKLGPDHDTTAKTRNNITQMQSIIASTNSNIGEAHRCQKQYAQALKWFQQALAVQENIKDANTATTYNNIALVYDDQQNYTRALEWLHKDLAISETAQNIGTATTYNNIGMVRFHQGNIADALEWYRKSLAIQEKLLGADSPDAAIIRGNIGEAYRTQGDYENALTELLSAYRTLATRYGENNRHTRAVRGNLARAYDKTDNTQPFAEWLAQNLSQ